MLNALQDFGAIGVRETELNNSGVLFTTYLMDLKLCQLLLGFCLSHGPRKLEHPHSNFVDVLGTYQDYPGAPDSSNVQTDQKKSAGKFDNK